MNDLPSRLFRMIDLLQGRGRSTAKWLAAELGVNERTVRRDVTRLQDLDVPVSVKVGRGGGILLEPGYLPALRFTDDEVLALGLGLHLAGLTSIPRLRAAAETVSRRLDSVTTKRLQRRLQALLATLASSDAPGQPQKAIRANLILDLAEAIASTQQLELSYRSKKNEVTTRRLEPYGLVHLEPHWYVAGYCHLRSATRVFRLDRVRRAEVMPIPFVPPATFDTLRCVTEAIAATLPPNAITCRVQVMASLAEVSQMIPDAAVTLEPNAAGTLLTAHCSPDTLEHVVLHLLGLPFELNALSPIELIEAFRAVAARALRQTS